MADVWLNIYDTSGNTKARISEYEQISECSTRSNTFGILKFRIHQDAEGRDQLVKRRWIEVYRQTSSGGDTIWSGIICHVKKMFDEAGNPTRYYEIIARDFNWMPYWRRMVPAANEDYLYKSGVVVDNAVKYLARQCMESGHASAERALSGLTVEADDAEHGDTKTLAGRYEDKLGDKLEAWAKAYDFDWWVEADCPNAAFVLRTKVPRRGSDKSSSVVFTVGRHNLLGLEYYEDDLDTAEFAYVGGPGEGATQVIREVYDGAEPTGWDRREVYVALANAEYTDELDVGGHAWLDSFGDTLTGVRFRLNETDAGKWRTDFDLGDVVTVFDSDFSVDKAAEIKEVNYTLTEDGIERIELLVGEPVPSKWDLLQAGIGAYSSFDDDSAPDPPVGLNVSTGTAQDHDGHWHSYLDITWVANTELDRNGYDVKWRVGGDTSTKHVPRGQTSEHVFPVNANSAYSVWVQATDKAGNPSGYCAAATGTTAKDEVAPATPSGLSVTAKKKAIRIEVDKNSEGDWAGNEFHVSTSDGFTPSDASLIHSGKTTSLTHHTASYVAHYVKVRAYDNADTPNYSAYTAQGTATPLQQDTPDYGNGSVTNPKINSLDCEKLTAGTMIAGVVYAGDIECTQIQAGTLNATVLVEAASIKAGTITADISIDGPGSITIGGTLTTGGGITCNSYILGDGYLGIKDGMTAPGASVGTAKLYVDSADGDLKVKFGDGTVKLIMTDT